MTTAQRIWILGAADPEMNKIEELLRSAGETVVFAMKDDKRVHPGIAYRGHVVLPMQAVMAALTVYFVECEVDVDAALDDVGGMGYPLDIVHIDHHRPGDPGYGRDPKDFFAASSIGQAIQHLAQLHLLRGRWDGTQYTGLPWDGRVEDGVGEGLAIGEVRFGCWGYHTDGIDGLECGSEPDAEGPDWIVGCPSGNYTGVVIPHDIIFTAAADHCLGAAYRGECPGVDPDELAAWRATSRAAFQKRTPEEVLADVERARVALRNAPMIELLGIADMPHTTDHDWSTSVCDGCAHDPVVVRDTRQARTITTVLVHPFVEGATVDDAGVVDSITVVFDGGPTGAWDEGGHHTFATVGIPELPEAACRDNIPYISGPLIGPDGRKKFTCSGNEQVVKAFFGWAERNGLVDCYGDPARGFAGGYLRSTNETY